MDSKQEISFGKIVKRVLLLEEEQRREVVKELLGFVDMVGVVHVNQASRYMCSACNDCSKCSSKDLRDQVKESLVAEGVEPNPGPRTPAQRAARTRRRKAAKERKRMGAKKAQFKPKNYVAQANSRRKAKTYGGVKQRVLSNGYLQALVLPEDYPVVRFPNKYGKRTGVVKTIANFNLPYLATAIGSCAAGTYSYCVTPMVHAPILALNAFTPSNGSTFNFATAQNSQDFGFKPLTLDIENADTETQSWTLGANEFINLALGAQHSDLAIPQYPTVQTLVDGSCYYGNVFPRAAALTVTVNVTTVGPIAAGETTTIQAIQPNGTVTSFTGVAGATLNRNSVSVVFNAGMLADCLCMPGIGLRLSASTTTAQTVTGVSITYSVGAGGVACTRYEPVEFPETSTYGKLWDEYRVNAASMLLTYRGNMLENGGSLGSLCYRGGQPFQYNGLNTYQGVTETPGSFDGPLTTGTYGFWAPLDERDMILREVPAVNRFDFPYMVCAGVVATPSQLNALRLRVVFHYEFVSAAQLWEYKIGGLDERVIAHANAVIANMPQTMENPLHLAKIGEMLKNVVRKGAQMLHDGVGWVVSNQGAIQATAGLLASLAL